MQWNDLSMSERAELIRLGVRSGLMDLKDIRNVYNSFAEGGSTDVPEPVNYETPYAITSRSNYRGSTQAPDSALYFNSKEDRDAYAAARDMSYSGGELPEVTVTASINSPRERALRRSREATSPNTDFNYAQDMNKVQRIGASYLAGIPIIGPNPHTCLNTVTGFYDPNNTVASNVNIVARPEDYGYQRIDQKDAEPGDLIILSNKNKHPKHAVMFDKVADGFGIHNGFNFMPGDTLVNYSNGGRSSSDYRLQGPLRRFDFPNLAGGDFSGPKTYLRYIGK